MPVQKFIHPLPKTILDDDNQRPFFKYLIDWLQYNAVGTISIESGLTDEQVSQLYPLDSDTDQQEEVSFSETIDTLLLTKKTISEETYTAQNNMFINMTNNSTLLFPEFPSEGSVIYFTKDDTQATVSGNGNPINGTTDDILFQNNRLARQAHYFSDVGEWFFV